MSNHDVTDLQHEIITEVKTVLLGSQYANTYHIFSSKAAQLTLKAGKYQTLCPGWSPVEAATILL